MKESLAVYSSAVVLVALAMFAPSKASAQVNIYVGPGGYGHYGYWGVSSLRRLRLRIRVLSSLRLRLLSSVRLRLLRRISRLLRWLLGPWASGSASRLASSRALVIA